MKTSLFLSSALILLAVGGCGHKKKEKGSSALVQDVARSKAKDAKNNLQGLKSSGMQGATLSGGDAQGRPLWTVSAEQIKTNGTLDSGSPKQATLTNARAILYQAGKPESNLKAPQIILFYTPKGVRLQMNQGVTGKSQGVWTGNHGPINFSAPRADVDVQNRVINASGGVKMNQGTAKVEGQTLHAQTSLKKADLKGKVKGNSPNGQIEADVATYDWQNSLVNAKKVTASQNGTKITGDALNGNTNASSGTLTGHVIATSDQGIAHAPKLDFDWKKDRIVANTATFAGQGGTLSADHLQTDSKLRVSAATGLVAQKDGATLRAVSADGFDSLVRIKGRGVSFKRADLTFTAPRADASKKGNKWVLIASGGARGQNASGTVIAPQVTWDESSNRVKASGGVTMQKDGSTLSGSRLDSDTAFNNATLTGNVRGKMQDGSTFSTGTLLKRGQNFFASNGATAHFLTKGQMGTLTVTAPKLVAAADGSTATATGGVTVKSATGATAHAPKAVYDRKTGKVTATGGVDFFDPVRNIRQHGETLVADLGLKEARLSHTTGESTGDLFKGKNPFKGLGSN